VLWFVGGALRASPAPDVNRAVSSSRLLTTVDRLMPQDLDALAENFRHAVADSDFPRVFEGVAPEQIAPVQAPDPGAVADSTIRHAEQSIVKILGTAPACRQGQEGSGAVIGPQRVVTNAHVVAGVDRPTVQVAGVGETLPARVVLFDAKRDIAVLAVDGMRAQALPLAAGNLPKSADALVAGFPGNGRFEAGPARVRSVLSAVGEDIYGGPGVTREVYSLYADVKPGNSGGPLLSKEGTLAGIVFARSLDDAHTGYALTLGEVIGDINAGKAATSAVSTGGCAQG
jgi:S1-C subfamily serine protease